MPAATDPRAARQHQITTDELRTRQTIHDQYTVPRVNFTEWVASTMQWQGDEHVLDVGAGAGTYHQAIHDRWPEVNYTGVDASLNMLEQHDLKRGLAQADAHRLPFAEDSFDVLMANHMLYHLRDIDAALTEFRRVLKPEGVLMVATNSVQSMPELQVLMRRAVILLAETGATQVQPPMPASHLFALENGSRRLHRHFYAVVRHDLPSKLVFPEVEPVMEYLESTRTFREPQLPEGVEWDEVMFLMRQQVTHLIDHLGEIVVNKLTGVLLASDRGGFIEGFIHHRDQHAVSE
jgi:SAM-dependent methyltransferase